MSDLIFDRSINKLSWPAKGKTLSAVSGIVGRFDMLPPGEYRVKRNNITQYTKYTGSPFKDKTGFGFFLPIEPRFTTSRSNLGIHPDGNVPGTEDCIGLTDHDTSDFYKAVASTPFSDLTLTVK